MMTRLTMPSVNGRRSILTGSFPATQAAVPSATAAALPQVTSPHSAPVSSAMRRPAASISSSRLTNQRDASVTAWRTCGSIRLPPCIVRTLQQLMNGRTPRARYGLVLVFMAISGPGMRDYSRLAQPLWWSDCPPRDVYVGSSTLQEDEGHVGAEAGGNRRLVAAPGRRQRRFVELASGGRSH